MNTWNSNT